MAPNTTSQDNRVLKQLFPMIKFPCRDFGHALVTAEYDMASLQPLVVFSRTGRIQRSIKWNYLAFCWCLRSIYICQMTDIETHNNFLKMLHRLHRYRCDEYIT